MMKSRCLGNCRKFESEWLAGKILEFDMSKENAVAEREKKPI